MFVVMSSKDHYYGMFQTKGEAVLKAKALAKEWPGVEFRIFKEIWSCGVPSQEQKENKDFWK